MYLQKIALGLGMKLDGSGEIGVNKSSGYTYLWLEDYSFVLYLSIACELEKHDVWIRKCLGYKGIPATLLF